MEDIFKPWTQAGYRPFPVHVFATPDGKREKKPLVPWLPYRTRQPTQDEVARFLSFPASSGVGIATGQGFAVIDIDSGVPLVDSEGRIAVGRLTHFDWFTDELLAMYVVTGGGGLHIYCRTPLPLSNATNVFDIPKEGANVLIDIRGDGGFVVTSPTRLYAGPASDDVLGGYALSPGGILAVDDLPLFPVQLMERLQQKTARRPSPLMQLDPDKPVGEGSRHDFARALALSMVNGAKKFEDLRIAKTRYKLALKQHFKDFDPEGKEAIALWDSAVRIVSGERGAKWTVAEPLARKAIKEVSVVEDLEKWPFNITRAVHVGDMIQLTVQYLDHERQLTMKAADLQIQPKFRAAFFQATSSTIPSIKLKSFETFVSSIIFERNEGYGTSITDDIIEILRQKAAKLVLIDSLPETVDELSRRGFARYGGSLYFRLSSLMQEPSIRIWTKSNVVLGLEQLGITQEETEGVGKVWEWVVT